MKVRAALSQFDITAHRISNRLNPSNRLSRKTLSSAESAWARTLTWRHLGNQPLPADRYGHVYVADPRFSRPSCKGCPSSIADLVVSSDNGKKPGRLRA